MQEYPERDVQQGYFQESPFLYLLKAQKVKVTGVSPKVSKDTEQHHLLITLMKRPDRFVDFRICVRTVRSGRRLRKLKIPCPTWWTGTGASQHPHQMGKKDPENGRYRWDLRYQRPDEPAHQGDCFPKDYRFKIGTIGEKKPEDWIVVEGQHEPLIDRMSFDMVCSLFFQQNIPSRFTPARPTMPFERTTAPSTD